METNGFKKLRSREAPIIVMDSDKYETFKY